MASHIAFLIKNRLMCGIFSYYFSRILVVAFIAGGGIAAAHFDFDSDGVSLMSSFELKQMGVN